MLQIEAEYLKKEELVKVGVCLKILGEGVQ